MFPPVSSKGSTIAEHLVFFDEDLSVHDQTEVGLALLQAVKDARYRLNIGGEMTTVLTPIQMRIDDETGKLLFVSCFSLI